MEAIIRINDAMCHQCDRHFHALNQNEYGENFCDGCLYKMADEIDLPWLKKRKDGWKWSNNVVSEISNEFKKPKVRIIKNLCESGCGKLKNRECDNANACYDCHAEYWNFQEYYMAHRMTFKQYYNQSRFWRFYRWYLVKFRSVRSAYYFVMRPYYILKHKIRYCYGWTRAKIRGEYYDDIPF